LFLTTNTVKAERAEAPIDTAPVKTGCELYKDIIRSYDWNDDIAIKIMMAESGCNANALNDNPRTGDYSVGLFQINLLGGLAKERPSEAYLRDPRQNIAYAYKLYTSSGFRPWTTYKKVI
jgi:hypothetical protein